MEWKPEGIEFNGIAGKPTKAYFLADSERNELPVRYDAEGHVTIIEMPKEAPDKRNTVIALEYDAPIVAAPDAKGKYHWYTTRSKRHTEIRRSAGAGKHKLPTAVEGN